MLKADPEILSIIKHGYKVPFTGDLLAEDGLPPAAIAPNNKSALDKPVFLLQELLRWERIGCTTRVSHRPRVVLPVSVVYSNKWRAVVDASRSINIHVKKNPVVLEPLSSIGNTVRKGDWFSKQDLSCGYFHVMIHPEHRDLFGVHFVHPDGSVSYWVWNVLFLGERNAVHLFTKILRPHRAFLASKGIRHRLWIDDFLISSPNFLKCLMDTKTHLEALYLAGWVVKPSKCQNHPVQKIQFLGLLLDSVSESFFIPAEKKLSILYQIQRVLLADFVPVRALAALYGLLISVALATGPSIRLLTRFGFDVINSASSWNQLVFISLKCKAELSYIAEHLDEMEGYSFKTAPASRVFYAHFYASDASGIGFGTIELFEEGGFSLVQQVAFTAEDMSKSSTFRELLAFHKCYTDLAFLSSIANQSVMHCTDSYNLQRMFEIGSKRSHLHSLLFEIFLNLRTFNIRLTVKWLPREDPTMVVADYFSRELDTTDYGISHTAFAALSSAWGPFDLDAFASDSNARLRNFYSKLYSTRALGMDALAHSWDDQHLWLCPPVSLVPQVLAKMASSRDSSGVLVVPQWPLASFWLTLLPDGVHFCCGVKNFVFFSPKWFSGHAVTSKMFRGVKKWQTLAVFLDSTVQNFSEANYSKNFCIKDGCDFCD